MKYTVKNKDGELTYGSMEELKNAYVLGLVEGDDEILEEGGQKWRKANAIPLLVTAKSVRVDQGATLELRAWVVGGLALAFLTFFLLLKSVYLWGGITAVLTAIVLARVTRMGAKRKK